MERVIIRKGGKTSLAILVREDAPVLYRIINDPEVHKYLSSPSRIYSLVDEYEWIDNAANVFGQAINFAILENETGQTIGVIGINPLESDGKGHIGYFLSRDSWGKGYMTEALSLMMDFAFHTMNLRKIYTNVYESNVGSRKVLEKNGFRHCGTMIRNHYIPGEGYADERTYEIFNPNFQ